MSTYSRQLKKMQSQQKVFTSLLLKMMRSKMSAVAVPAKPEASASEKKPEGQSL